MCLFVSVCVGCGFVVVYSLVSSDLSSLSFMGCVCVCEKGGMLNLASLLACLLACLLDEEKKRREGRVEINGYVLIFHTLPSS